MLLATVVKSSISGNSNFSLSFNKCKTILLDDLGPKPGSFETFFISFSKYCSDILIFQM